MTLDVDRFRELLAKATPLPWLYRPDKHDDWGWVRGGPKHAFGRVIVAAAREGRVLDEDELSAHRRNKTDPCAPNAELIVAAVNALPSLLTRIAELEKGLGEIAALEPSQYEMPADWSEQIAACPECQRYQDHPIQRGICDTHRQPLWARERHDSDEERRLGCRAKAIATTLLSGSRCYG